MRIREWNSVCLTCVAVAACASMTCGNSTPPSGMKSSISGEQEVSTARFAKRSVLATHSVADEPVAGAVVGDSLILARANSQLERVRFNGEQLWASDFTTALDGPDQIAVSDQLSVFAVTPSGAAGASIFDCGTGKLIAAGDMQGLVVAALAFEPGSAHILWIVSHKGDVERWSIDGNQIVKLDHVGKVDARTGARISALLETREMLVVGRGYAVTWSLKDRRRSRELAAEWLTPDTQVDSAGSAISVQRARGSGGLALNTPAIITVWSAKTFQVVHTLGGGMKYSQQAHRILGAFPLDKRVLVWSDEWVRLLESDADPVIAEVSAKAHAGVVCIVDSCRFIVSEKAEAVGGFEIGQYQLVPCGSQPPEE